MLRTKLYRPPVTSEQVLRTRLIKQLNDNLHLPLTLVSAPAGYGKSTVVSQWLEATGINYAWVSLDEGTDELSEFLRYLIASIQQRFNNYLISTMELVDAPETIPNEVLIESFINELDSIEEELILVLDDYHHIRSEEIHSLIQSFAKFPPQAIHLVISTRRDPPLPIHDLRIYGRINEIRIKDLCFDESEIQDLFQNIVNVPLEYKDSVIIKDKTEGWILGLKMSLLHSGREFSLDDFFSGLDKGIPEARIILQEALQYLSEQHRTYVLFCSLFDSFCYDLITTIAREIRQVESEEVEGFVDEFSMFIIGLDDQRKWFRFHHLYREILSERAKEAFKESILEEIHLIAYTWFKNNDLLDEALTQAIDGKYYNRAVDLVTEYRYHLMNNEEWSRLINWLKLFPEEIINTSPLLMTTRVIINEYQGDLGSMQNNFQKLLGQLPDLRIEAQDKDAFNGELDTIIAEISFIQGHGDKAISHGENALALLPNEALYIKTFAMYWYSFGHQMTKNLQKGIEVVFDALEDREGFTPTALSRLKIAITCMYFMNGEFTKAMYWANECLIDARQHELNESIFLAYSFISKIQYLRNEIKTSRPNFKEFYDKRYVGRGAHAVVCSLPHWQSFLFEGEYEKAKNHLEEVRVFVKESGQPAWNEIFLMLEIDFFIQTKQWKSLSPLLDQMNPEHFFPPAWFSYHTCLVPVKVLCSVPNNIDLDKALAKIDFLIGYGREINNICFLMAAIPYKVLIHWKREEINMAFGCLEEVLRLASSEGIKRFFFDLGDDMKSILMAYKKDYNHQFVDELLNEFPNVLQNKTHENSSPNYKPLTRREKEILDLVSEGFRNKEIAQKLSISAETVKRHMTNIYHKFGVHNRISLLKKAKAFL